MKVVEIDSSHLVMLSHPAEVADVIREALASIAVMTGVGRDRRCGAAHERGGVAGAARSTSWQDTRDTVHLWTQVVGQDPAGAGARRRTTGGTCRST